MVGGRSGFLVSYYLHHFGETTRPPRLPLSSLRGVLVTIFSFVAMTFNSRRYVVLVYVGVVLRGFRLSSRRLVRVFYFLHVPRRVIVSPGRSLPTQRDRGGVRVHLALYGVSPPKVVSYGCCYVVLYCFSLPMFLSLGRVVLPSFVGCVREFVSYGQGVGVASYV